jgi:cytochrome c peroxidase
MMSRAHFIVRRAVFASLALLAISFSAFEPAHAAEAYPWRLPAWVPLPVVPAENPMTSSKVELGRHLFYDPRLSANQSLACASCHQQAKAFSDGRRFSRGVNGALGTKSAMALANVAYLPVLTWANPQLTSLEVQALIPLFGEHPLEMGMAGREADLFQLLQQDRRYPALFKNAFPSEAEQGEKALFSLSTLTKALASFQRSLLSFQSPYDRYKYGNAPNAISVSAKRGEALFFGEKMECYHCHGGLNFSDNIRHVRNPDGETGFHNTGLYNVAGEGGYPASAPGIVEFTGDSQDRGKFRTPSLRNIALTGPYMHDGSIATLAEVVTQHYAKAGRSSRGSIKNPLRSEFIEGFEISPQETRDLVAFLASLTDPHFIANPATKNPWINLKSTDQASPSPKSSGVR